MFTSVVAYALLGFSFAACLLAFARGGTPERLGAAAILLNLFAGMANETHGQGQVVGLAIDAVTALALLPVALRYPRAWLGVVMILYALQFSLHAWYAVLNKPRDLLHVQLNNINFVLISACLAVGAATAWRRRRRTGAAD
jgi:hypothetical protein